MSDENLSLSDRLKILKSKEEEKKKELEELKKKIDEESDEIKKEINQTLRALREEEENLFEEKERKEDDFSIDEQVSKESSDKSIISQSEYKSVDKKNVYDFANRDSYNKFKDLIDKAERGYASQNEMNFLSKMSNKLTEFKIGDSYTKKKDPDNYLARMQKLIDDFQK